MFAIWYVVGLTMCRFACSRTMCVTETVCPADQGDILVALTCSSADRAALDDFFDNSVSIALVTWPRLYER